MCEQNRPENSLLKDYNIRPSMMDSHSLTNSNYESHRPMSHIKFASLWTENQGSMDRQARGPTGPRCENFSWSQDLNFLGPCPVRLQFRNFSRSGPVPIFENFLGPGPSWSRISGIFPVLVRSVPRTRTEPLGPGPIGFGPWVPDWKFEIYTVLTLPYVLWFQIEL